MNREPLHRQSVHRRGVNAGHGIRISFFTAHTQTTHAAIMRISNDRISDADCESCRDGRSVKILIC